MKPPTALLATWHAPGQRLHGVKWNIQVIQQHFFEKLSMTKISNAIDVQRNIICEIDAKNGASTRYDTD